MRAALFAPMLHHAGLRKRERQERADGVQRNQAVRDALKKNEQESGKNREYHDAVRVHQPAAAVTESVRKIIILRDGAAQAWKVGECGVRGKAKEPPGSKQWSRSRKFRGRKPQR